MSEERNLMEEMNHEETGVDTMPAENQEEKTEDKRIWHDAEGNEVSMSQFIREQFTLHNKSRKEISDEFDINYRTVYGATVNMTNDAEPATRGRGVVNPKIHVTVDNQVYTEKEVETDGVKVTKYFLNNEEILPNADGEIVIPETTEVDRNSWIKEQVDAGANRGDVAKILDLSYGVVYGLTKDAEGARQKYEVEIGTDENGNPITMGRSEYIRKRVADGVSKADVAKELGVEYSVVWQATKKDKTDAEKFFAAIESLEKMADVIEEKDAFLAAIEALKNLHVKAEEEKTENTDEAKTDVE